MTGFMTQQRALRAHSREGALLVTLCCADDRWCRAQVLQAQGGVARQAPERVARLRYSRGGQLLACQSAGKLLELFRCGARAENAVSPS